MITIGPIKDLAAWAKEAIDIIDGRPCVVSVSGGKDSTATCLLLREAGIPFQAIHMDTGWEHEATESYVREYLPGIIGPIRILKSKKGGMEDLIKHKGMFPSRMRRFCTQELKVFPFHAYFKEIQLKGEDPISVVGIRAGESKAREKLSEWEHITRGADYEMWRPIIRFSEPDVIALHQRHGIKPNPLYLKGATRVGCWPCIFARKKEIRLISEIDPARIDRIERLEADVTKLANDRHAKAGKPMRSPPRYFQAKLPMIDNDGEKTYPCWPIRKVVEWSTTARGGRQFQLFGEDYASDGCMRWGMCETEPESTKQEDEDEDHKKSTEGR